MIFYIRGCKDKKNYFEVEYFVSNNKIKIKPYLYTSNWIKLVIDLETNNYTRDDCNLSVNDRGYDCEDYLIPIIEYLENFSDYLYNKEGWFSGMEFNKKLYNNIINTIRNILKDIFKVFKFYDFDFIED